MMSEDRRNKIRALVPDILALFAHIDEQAAVIERLNAEIEELKTAGRAFSPGFAEQKKEIGNDGT